MSFAAGLMPGQLSAHLDRLCPGFRSQTPEHRHSLARMLWLAHEPRRRHRVWPHMASFTKSDIRAIWGDDKRMRDVLRGQFFRVLAGSAARDGVAGYSSAFQPVHEMLEAVLACAQAEPGPLMIGARTLHRSPQAIDPLRAYSGTRAEAWQGIAPACMVPIEAEALRLARDQFSASEQQSIDVLLALANNTLAMNHLPIRYAQYSTGRLFADGNSLQFTTRAVRATALQGCWDYDLRCCHHTILLELARRAGHDMSAVAEYVENRSSVRHAIAAACELGIETVKKALLMVIYGAPVTTSVHATMAASLGAMEAQRLCGPGWLPEPTLHDIGSAAVARLQGCPQFMAIYREVKSVRQDVIDRHTASGGWVINPLRIRRAASERTAVALAHVLQGYEAAALRAIVKAEGENVILCMHDGWVTRNRLSLNVCEAIVGAATTIPLRIDEQRLQPAPAAERVHGQAKAELAEISLEDQQLSGGAPVIPASSSRLLGCSSSVLAAHPGPIVSVRADWNYAD